MRSNRGQELAEALQREVLALDRDERRVGRRERVDRQQAERWRAVDEDVVVLRADGAKKACEPSFTLLERRELDFGPGEGHGRRNQRQPVDLRLDREVGELGVVDTAS